MFPSVKPLCLGVALAALLSACEEPGLSPDGAGAVLSEAVAETSPARVIVAPAPSHPVPRRGVITAGDIDDRLNLAGFTRYLNRAVAKTGLPKADLGQPVALRLVGAGGKPAPGVHVNLYRPGRADPFWTGLSGVDGHITVFPGVFGAKRLREVELRAIPRRRARPLSPG